MKFVRLPLYLSVACNLIFSAQISAAVELEHLDGTRINTLRDKFVQAQILDKNKIAELNQSKWVCDMYGMSSRMQVERGVRLYHFSSSKQGNSLTLRNLGAQVVKAYGSENGLSGQKGSLQDQIRISKDGRLISRLEIRSPQTKDVRTLAISICDRQKI